MAAYDEGKRTLSQDYRYTAPNGDVLWARCVVNLTKRPVSGDIILFSAVSDITQEKLTEAIVDRVIAMQYDYLACLDAKHGTIVMFISNTPSLLAEEARVGCNYEMVMRSYNKRCVTAADYEACTQFMCLDNVMRILNQEKRCILSIAVEEQGELRTKQVEFFYVDKESQLIALVRSDYTETQRRQLEQEAALQAALAEAQKANRAKSDFLSSMSHDIRTPLNGIIGMTYLTKEMDLPEKVLENLDKIDVSSQFLLSLINDVLDMAKAESGKIELQLEPYEAGEFQRYLQAVILPLCESKQQKFIVDIQAVTTVTPLMDKLRVNQIFFNLLSNAVKYTPEGGTITYRLREHVSSAGQLVLHCDICDTGVGISKEFLPRLFEPFTQEERQAGEIAKGTGLGLAIVKRLLELMGGTISVQSSIGKGTTFSLQVAFDCIPAGEENKAAAYTGPADSYDQLQGRRVLLCEDHPLNQEIAKALLVEMGMIVDVAGNGKVGVAMFEASIRGFYDIILMDIRMPFMNGYEAMAMIRDLQRPDAKNVPILAMTADAFSDDVQRAFASGMNGHIAKPINPEMLFSTILSLIT